MPATFVVRYEGNTGVQGKRGMVRKEKGERRQANVRWSLFGDYSVDTSVPAFSSGPDKPNDCDSFLQHCPVLRL